MQPVFVVTVEQWHAESWGLEGAFDSEEAAWAHADSLKLEHDTHVYRCVGSDIDEVTRLGPPYWHRG